MANPISFSSSNYISQRIASNMNIQDLTPQSKIGVLVNGLLNEDAIFKTYTEDSNKNFYLQTADEDSLERFGIAEGISRIKTPSLRVRAEDAAISIKRTTAYAPTITLEKGVQLELVSETYWLVLTEELDLSTAILDKAYISCDIKAGQSETNLSFLQGVSYNVNINGDTYEITFEKNISIPVLEESLETFRARLIYAKDSPRSGSESAIRLAVASNELITDFNTNFDTNPVQLLIFNHTLFDDDTELDSLLSYAIPVLDTQLDLIKSEGISYDISVVKKVNLTLALKAIVANPRSVALWDTFKDYVYSLYKVGSPFEISVDLFTVYLNTQGEDTSFLSDYDFVIYKNFLGNEYLSTSKKITILADEYPYINEVRVE